MRSIQQLEDLLAGPGRIGVLRTLARADGPLTGRQIAKIAGLSHAGAGRFLARLHEAGLVTRTEVGRAVLHEFERGNPLVTKIVHPLFAAEQTLLGAPPSPATGDDLTANRVNPRVRPYLAAVEDACRRHHVTSSALFGSSTQIETGVVPKDLDILVTFERLEPRMKAQQYAELVAELESIMGMRVDVMVSTAVRNPYLAEEIERTKVVLYEVA
jgi:hypothetical protein